MASLKRWLEARRYPWKKDHLAAMSRWKRDNRKASLLYQYDDLAPRPVVWDVGGFEGGWTDILRAARPEAIVHVFEPHPRFAAALNAKFKDVADVHVHPFALGREAGQIVLDDAGDASSAFRQNENGLSGDVVDVSTFWSQAGSGDIDLVKMNIEGGEYDLLPAMLDAGVLGAIKRLQVQFHLFERDLVAARDEIRSRLSRSHDCIWDYPFVWEEWRRR